MKNWIKFWKAGVMMVRKIALSSTGPLSGKTTFALFLEWEYKFVRVDHSRTLVQNFVDAWNAEQGEALTIEDVYADKETWRGALQVHGNLIGFNEPRMALYWIEQTLKDWAPKHT